MNLEIKPATPATRKEVRKQLLFAAGGLPLAVAAAAGIGGSRAMPGRSAAGRAAVQALLTTAAGWPEAAPVATSVYYLVGQVRRGARTLRHALRPIERVGQGLAEDELAVLRREKVEPFLEQVQAVAVAAA